MELAFDEERRERGSAATDASAGARGPSSCLATGTLEGRLDGRRGGDLSARLARGAALEPATVGTGGAAGADSGAGVAVGLRGELGSASRNVRGSGREALDELERETRENERGHRPNEGA